MRNKKKVLVGGLALTLLFSQGLPTVSAKGKDEKPKVADKNKNGIDDNWEKKYKLKGKNIAKQDNDKDGLNNLTEYKLKLNPTKMDTDKNGVNDGQEDSDEDGLSNSSELELGLKPDNAYSKNASIKDGEIKDKNGVQLSDKIRELEISIEADDQEIEIEYYLKKDKPYIKVKDKSRTITKETIEKLVNELQAPSSITEEAVVEKPQESPTSTEVVVVNPQEAPASTEGVNINPQESPASTEAEGDNPKDPSSATEENSNEVEESQGSIEDELVEKIQALFNLEGSYSIEVSIEYFSGEEFEFEKEIEVEDNDNDDNDEHDEDDDEEHEDEEDRD